jgi:pimeloyl-ACP methyl ester carboxylesterase
MATCDEMFMRLPLSGVGAHTYHKDWRGKVCQWGNVIGRVTTLTCAILALLGILPPGLFYPIAMIAPAAALIFYSAGSAPNRNPWALLFELILFSVCAVLAVLSYAGILSVSQAAIGVIAALAGALVVSIPADQGRFRKIEMHSLKGDYVLKNVDRYLSPWPLRAIDYLIGVSRDGLVSAISMVSSLSHRHHYLDRIPNIEHADALCVIIHGLASRPAVLDDYYDDIKSKKGRTTLFQPYVTKNGECSLQEAAEHIEDKITTWARAHPAKPIVWIGHSNGARIAGALSARLKLNGIANPMQVHCIGGPFYGTRFVNQPSWPRPLRRIWESAIKKIYSKAVYQELSWQSQTATTIIEEMQQAAYEHEDLRYCFYASGTDLLVLPWTSALPKVANASYFIAYAEGHQGIVPTFKDHIIQESLSFVLVRGELAVAELA